MNATSGPTALRDTAAPAARPGGSATDAVTRSAGGALGKNEFVKLLVTEMRNQDPTSPMDGKELAVQLAQFSSVEQLVNVNAKLDDLTQMIKARATPGTPGGATPVSTSGQSGS